MAKVKKRKEIALQFRENFIYFTSFRKARAHCVNLFLWKKKKNKIK